MRSNGSIIGVETIPTSVSAPGVWDLATAFRERKSGTWPLGHDPYFANVELLLHCNGTDGSTTFTDSSANARTVTAHGNAQIDTAQSKFGGASALYDGTGDYLSLSDSADFDLGLSGDPFTVEGWARVSSTSSSGIMLLARGGGTAGWNSTTGHQYLFGFISSSTLYCQWWKGSIGAISVAVSSTSIAANTWFHLAATYDGTNMRMFVNGTLVVTGAAGTIAKPSSSTTTRIGADASGGLTLNGHNDEIRVTKGVCRYTADFTPPPIPFFDS